MSTKARSIIQHIAPTVTLFAVCLTAAMRAEDRNVLWQRVLQASHSTRIDDRTMKPWHLKVNFQLNDAKGKLISEGILDEWWADPLLWKVRIESPLYTATIIENRDGDFRTQGVSPIPLRIRAIQEYFIYPMPMGESPGDTKLSLHHEKLEKIPVNCVEMSEPTTAVAFPTFCFEPQGDVLRAIQSVGSGSVHFDDIADFQGRSVAHSATIMQGKLITAKAMVVDLAEIPLSDVLYKPSADMTKVTDMHTFRITVAR